MIFMINEAISGNLHSLASLLFFGGSMITHSFRTATCPAFDNGRFDVGANEGPLNKRLRKKRMY